MSAASADTAAPLDEVMLAMDVVDTLRHSQNLVTRELDDSTREEQLIARLRDIYHNQGIDVPDHILREGVAALAQSRFVYTPPPGGLKTSLARIYVKRKTWGPPLVSVTLGLVIAFGGYFLVYRPWQASQVEQARIELAEGLPAQMDSLYDTIFQETKVQQASIEAEEMVRRGKAAAGEGNRVAAMGAVENLTALRDRLRQEYLIKVVNRQAVKSSFWTFPEINTEATNFYIVVEALDADGTPLSLPIVNEENGQTEAVSLWGLRVPEAVYNSVSTDKLDDGIIERNVVGRKQFGFLDVDYVVPVLGGAVTRW